MKKLLLLTLFYTILFSQEKAHVTELVLYTINESQNPIELNFELRKVSHSYCYDLSNPSAYFECYENICTEVTIFSVYGNTVGDDGWDICWDSQNTIGYFGYGVYRLMCLETGVRFYIDFRDPSYANSYYPPHPDTDIYFRYDISAEKFQFKEYQTNDNWIDITNGELLKIWELKNNNNLNQNNLSAQFWQNSLALIDENFHPKLIWSTDANVNVTHYKIYRSVSWIDEEEPSNDFVYLKQVNSSTGSFVDYSAVIGVK